MLPVKNYFPSFEANQVLTNQHLNQMRDYLDEQTRLTRTNLIGIGIVCGLNYTVEPDGSAIHISKGCGITSEGHLVAWENPGPLDYYKPYTVPDDVSYAVFFGDDGEQYNLWELDLDQNDDPEAIPLTLDFLSGNNMSPGSDDEKVLLIFVECLAEDNRNCSPNSCDDKGKQITITIKPLLIRRQDLDIIQEKILSLGQPAQEYFGLTGILNLRNSLPELRMRKYNVEATSLIYTADVFDSFQHILNEAFINQVATALNDLYTAFEPILVRGFSENPFDGLAADWAFLHNGGIVAQDNHLFMQYFYDHIYTIILAYNEFREKGLELYGLCCPDPRLFPRHLMLGIALPEADNPAYRHHFAPSPIHSRFSGALRDLVECFRRLVLLVEGFQISNANAEGGNQGFAGAGNFTINPAFTNNVTATNYFANPFANQALFNYASAVASFLPNFLNLLIKVTPSNIGAYPLSTRAIPYHYDPVPLYETWNPEKTRQMKANLNLGYRATAWNTTDDFVLNPLRYDYEEKNFYRIEGHIGLNYREALQTIIQLKSTYRLPFDVIALKTGRNSDDINLSEDIISCNFQDLEAIYDASREELLCHLCELIQYLYNIRIRNAEGQPITDLGDGQTPSLSFLRNCAPNYEYFNGTIGQVYETVAEQLSGIQYVDIDQGNVVLQNILNGWTFYLFGNVGIISNQVYVYPIIFIYYSLQLAESLSGQLEDLNFEDFQNRYEDLLALVTQLDDILVQQNADEDTSPSANPNAFWSGRINSVEFQDQLNALMYACKLEPFVALYQEYLRRLREVRDSYLLQNFAVKHPGIEHKAGVTKNGTFILVYHDFDESQEITPVTGNFTIRGNILNNGELLIGVNVVIAGTSIGTVTDFDGNFQLNSPILPVTLIISYTGFANIEYTVFEATEEVNIDFSDFQSGDDNRYPNIQRGQVIADFYLPYQCCSDCPPITFTLPPPPFTFMWEQVGCTLRIQDPTVVTHVTYINVGQIQITTSEGVPPFQFSIDGGVTWQDLGSDTIQIRDGGSILLRDAAGTTSGPQTVNLRPPLSYQIGDPECSDDGNTFSVPIQIIGGTPPYNINFLDTTLTLGEGEVGSLMLPNNQGADVLIEDNSDPTCSATAVVAPYDCSNLCGLPCGGETTVGSYTFPARNSDFIYWVNRALDDGNLTHFRLRINALVIDGQTIISNVNPVNVDIPIFVTNRNGAGFLNEENTFETFTHNFRLLFSHLNLYTNGLLVFDTPPENAPFGNFDQFHLTHFSCHDFLLDIATYAIGTTSSGAEYQVEVNFTGPERYRYTQDGRIPIQEGAQLEPRTVVAEQNICDCQSPRAFGKIEVAGYRWIDSAAFLAGFATDDEFPEYILTILEYRVGNEIFVDPASNPDVITIPAEAITEGGIGLIMEMLNERFPEGLMFSNEPVIEDPKSREFVIRRFVSDTFVLRIAFGKPEEITEDSIHVFTENTRSYYQWESQTQGFVFRDYGPSLGKRLYGIENLCLDI